MTKRLFIAEKPSVAQEFARILGVQARRGDGYLESEDTVVTWCVGHLVTMSYPECYDEALKKWDFATLPFLPDEFLYEVIPSVKKQFHIVKGLLNREDVDTIYNRVSFAMTVEEAVDGADFIQETIVENRDAKVPCMSSWLPVSVPRPSSPPTPPP